MNDDLNYSQIPKKYALCINAQCPKSATCLRYIAVQYMPPTEKLWSILSPIYINSLQNDCPYYSRNRKVRFARGLLGILKKLNIEQLSIFSNQIIETSSRRTYYRIRCGERPISPEEQQSLLNVLRQCGVTETLEFDSYYEDYQWK